MLASQKRIERYVAGSDRFAGALRTFLPSTDEYSHLLAHFKSTVLRRLAGRGLFLEIGPGTGDALTRELRSFRLGVGVEPTSALHGALRQNAPNIEIIGRRFQDISEQELLNAVSRREPRLLAGLSGAFDLIQFAHVFYYEDHQVCTRWLEMAAELVAKGGMIFCALQAENSDFHKMFRHFIGERYSLERLTAEFEAERRGFRVDSHLLPGTVRLRTLEQALDVAGFMLCYGDFELPEEREVARYIEQNFKAEDGSYVIQNWQRAVVLERLA